MVEGRGEFEWSMTAHQMALQINMNRKKGTKAVKPDVLNPFVRKKIEEGHAVGTRLYGCFEKDILQRCKMKDGGIRLETDAVLFFSCAEPPENDNQQHRQSNAAASNARSIDSIGQACRIFPADRTDGE